MGKPAAVALILGTNLFASLASGFTEGAPDLRLDGEFEVASSGHSPGVAFGASGTFTVVWSERAAYMRHFRETGDPGGEPMLLSSDATEFTNGLRLAGNASGDMVAVWSGKEGGTSAGPRIRARLLRAYEAPVGQPILISATPAFEQMPAVGVGDDGGFVVVWREEDELWGRSFDANGSPSAGEFVITRAADPSHPVVALDADGGFLVSWRVKDDGRQGRSSLVSGVLARRFDRNHEPTGPEIRVSTLEGTTGVGASTANGRAAFSAVFSTRDPGNRGVFIRRIWTDGARLGEPLRFAPSIDPDSPIRPGEMSSPAVATTTSGDFVAVWMTQFPEGRPIGMFTLEATTIDRDLESVGRGMRVSHGHDANLYTPAVATSAAGLVVLVWAELRGDELGAVRGRLGRLER